MSRTYGVGMTIAFVVTTAAFTAALTPLLGSIPLAVLPALFIALGIVLTMHFGSPRRGAGGSSPNSGTKRGGHP
jgi:hypothetical protein